MRKLICILAALMLFAASALAELSVTVDSDVPADAAALGISSLETSWIQSPSCYRCVLTWQYNDQDYEASIIPTVNDTMRSSILFFCGI